LDEREKRKIAVLKQEVHERDIHIIVVKTSSDAQVRTLVEEVAGRDASLGRRKNVNKEVSALWFTIEAEKVAAIEWRSRHDTVARQLESSKQALSQRGLISSASMHRLSPSWRRKFHLHGTKLVWLRRSCEKNWRR
jgi:hypothetical protein